MTEEEMAVQKAETLGNMNDAIISATDEHVYDDIQQDIQSLVTAVSNVISEHSILKDKNFGLYYQHGRLGYMDLDVFASKIKNAESEKTIDKENE